MKKWKSGKSAVKCREGEFLKGRGGEGEADGEWVELASGGVMEGRWVLVGEWCVGKRVKVVGGVKGGELGGVLVGGMYRWVKKKLVFSVGSKGRKGEAYT